MPLEGATAGAPAAIQVADRWHLWHNLGEYAEKTVVAHRGCLAPAAEATAAEDPDAPGGRQPLQAGPDGLRDVCGRERALVSRTLERHAAVHGLLKAGHTQREAARILGLDPGTVSRFAREPDPAALLVKATNRDSKLDPFKAYINHRWNQGITDAAVLHAELAATQGWTGSVQAVRRYVNKIKMIKRRMYGRASFPLLRKRVILHPA